MNPLDTNSGEQHLVLGSVRGNVLNQMDSMSDPAWQFLRGAVQMLPDATRGKLTWRQADREMFGRDVTSDLASE